MSRPGYGISVRGGQLWRPVLMCALVFSITLAGSCARRQSVKRDTPRADRTRISLQEDSRASSMEELALPQIEDEKKSDYTFNRAENLFDVNLVEADLASTLQSMCDMLEYNLVMGSQITDTLNLSLHDVTFFKFLEIALESQGYEYRLEDRFLYVDKPGLETRVFHLNYLTTTRQVTGTMTITGQGGAASGGLIPQSNTTLQSQNTVNLWSDIRNTLEGIVLGQGQQMTAAVTAEGSFAGSNETTGHRLVMIPSTGVVQVTASREILDMVDEYLAVLEATLQRQVLIEARFVEINLSNSLDAGMDWSVIPDLTSVSNLSGNLTGGAVAAQALSPTAREFQMGVSNNNISAILTAIARHGTVNVLQSPQVSALNNQPAVIRIARNETFFQRTETPGQPATATSPATQPVVNYEPIQQPTGVVLNITPQISGEGMIIMSIRPSITSIAAVATSPDGLSTSPITDVRELDTVAKVRHGQTIILAGLIQERDTEDVSETPVLSKLPILGNLFKQVRKDREKVELVILLTPYINYSRTKDELAEDHLQRYKEVAKRYRIKEEVFNQE